MVLVLALKHNEQYFVVLSKGELITHIHIHIHDVSDFDHRWKSSRVFLFTLLLDKVHSQVFSRIFFVLFNRPEINLPNFINRFLNKF